MKFESESLPAAIARASPGIYMGVGIVYITLTPDVRSIYLFLALVSVFITNWIFKNIIFQVLYHFVNITTGQNSLPILGIGMRPPGATSCGLFLDGRPGNTTFGMPSGHSQITWAIGTYLILRIIEHQTNTIKKWIIILLIGTWMVYVAYSRVYIANCHTIQQVIIGGLIGVGCGYFIWKMESTFIQWIRSIKSIKDIPNRVIALKN